jgi:hypothetical protein
MLNLISFVGVDEHTNLKNIIQFDALATCEFYLEFGFLYSETRCGVETRYPSLSFIKDSVEFLNSGIVCTSVHLCGTPAIKKYLELDSELMDICYGSRIQLNFNLKDFNEDELIDNILYNSKQHPYEVIVQVNKTKKTFVEKLLKRVGLSNINLLYDGSGGFGKEISKFERPFQNIFTGYAGGLKPGNIASTLKSIDAINPLDDDFYLDMESGVRTDNVFSLEKCKMVVDEVLNM